MVFIPNASSNMYIVSSLIGSAIGAAVVFGLAWLIPGGLSPVRLAILGTVIGTFLSGTAEALAAYFQISQNISFWYNARSHAMDPELIKLSIPFAIVGLCLAVVLSKSITPLSLGDETAKGLGVNTWLIKALAMVAVVILTGVSVALAGKVAFVGLIIPHIARFLSGSDYRWIIPVSGVLGGMFLALCDILARFVNDPFETPVGVITSLIGVPFFLYLIKTREGLSVRNTYYRFPMVLTGGILVVLTAVYFSLTNGTFDMSIKEVFQTLLRMNPNSDFDLVVFEFRRLVLCLVLSSGLRWVWPVQLSRGYPQRSCGSGHSRHQCRRRHGGCVVYVPAARADHDDRLVRGYDDADVRYRWRFGGNYGHIYVRQRKRKAGSARLILVGIAIASGFGAITMFLSLKMNPSDYEMAVAWLAGAFTALTGSSWSRCFLGSSSAACHLAPLSSARFVPAGRGKREECRGNR